MFIQTESTPNPATLKFLPGQTVLDAGTADFPSADTAGKSPLATRLFKVEGVTGVFLGTDFVTVTKADGVDWDVIKPALLGAIMEHFQSGQPVMDGDEAAVSGHAEHDGEDGEIVNQIKELLDTRVRPAVAQDGGDIVFHGFDRGVVYLLCSDGLSEKVPDELMHYVSRNEPDPGVATTWSLPDFVEGPERSSGVFHIYVHMRIQMKKSIPEPAGHKD